MEEGGSSERWEALRGLKRHPEETGIFLDLDGTLAELVDVPEAVHFPAPTRKLLRTLDVRYGAVVIISGRAASSIQDIVGLPNLTYVGNHGLEVIESHRRQIWLSPSDADRMRAMEDPLRRSIQWDGVLLELKELSHAIHYRRSPEPTVARTRILATLEEMALEGVQIREGKFLVQIRPDAYLDKGTAVDRLAGERGLAKLIYVGDDTTDLDAFGAIEALRRGGAIEGHRVAVMYPDTPEELVAASDLQVEGVQQVQDLLAWLAR